MVLSEPLFWFLCAPLKFTKDWLIEITPKIKWFRKFHTSLSCLSHLLRGIAPSQEQSTLHCHSRFIRNNSHLFIGILVNVIKYLRTFNPRYSLTKKKILTRWFFFSRMARYFLLSITGALKAQDMALFFFLLQWTVLDMKMYLKKSITNRKNPLFFLVSSNNKALVKCFYIFSSCKELSNKSFHLEVPNGKKCVRRFKETQ